jgi:hypothetical protein
MIRRNVMLGIGAKTTTFYVRWGFLFQFLINVNVYFVYNHILDKARTYRCGGCVIISKSGFCMRAIDIIVDDDHPIESSTIFFGPWLNLRVLEIYVYIYNIFLELCMRNETSTNDMEILFDAVWWTESPKKTYNNSMKVVQHTKVTYHPPAYFDYGIYVPSLF